MDCLTPKQTNRWLVAIIALVFAACSKQPPLDDFGPLPPFELTNEKGQPFGSKQLLGHVWIADFIYTTCPGPCPRMSSIMARLQTELGSNDFRLVSFTVDPAKDSPEAFSQYALKFKADPNRWTFLTGKPETLQMLNRHGFKLGDVDGSLDHSTRFALVDQKMHVRGFYGTSEEDGISQLKKDVARLVREAK
jgi:protein SCO1